MKKRLQGTYEDDYTERTQGKCTVPRIWFTVTIVANL